VFLIRPKKLAERLLRRYGPLFRLASKLYHRVDNSFKTLSPGTPEALEKAFQKVMQRGPSEAGDYYEFGIYRGYAFWKAQQICNRLGLHDTSFYGFDSFAGLPSVDGIDQTNNQFFEGQFACSKEDVVRHLSKNGVDWSKTVLVEGYFDQSLTGELKQKYPFKKVAVALVDCDLYSSTKDVLTWSLDLFDDGSILLFDDWYSFGNDPALGQQRAFLEFLAANPHFEVEPFGEFPHHGKSFILHKVR
jgi:hypothetical protein